MSVQPMRAFPVLVLVAALGASSAATQEVSASEQGARRLYEAARRCFVANGYVHSRFQDAGDQANATRFDQQARQAFELSHAFGKELHLGQAQINRDIEATTAKELPRLMQEKGYLTSVAAFCKARELM